MSYRHHHHHQSINEKNKQLKFPAPSMHQFIARPPICNRDKEETEGKYSFLLSFVLDDE
jgi:hypothetical protein